MGSGQWSNGDSRRALEHSPREKQFTHKRKRDVRDRDADKYDQNSSPDAGRKGLN